MYLKRFVSKVLNKYKVQEQLEMWIHEQSLLMTYEYYLKVF